MFPKATQECRVHSSFYLRVSFFKIAHKVANNLGYVPLLEILSLRIFINRPIWSHWLREIEEGSCYSLNVFFGVLLTTLTMASPVASMASVVRIRRCFERPVPNKRHWITKGHFIPPSPPLFDIRYRVVFLSITSSCELVSMDNDGGSELPISTYNLYCCSLTGQI